MPCSICHKSGHNIRTCPLNKSVKRSAIVSRKQRRRKSKIRKSRKKSKSKIRKPAAKKSRKRGARKLSSKSRVKSTRQLVRKSSKVSRDILKLRGEILSIKERQEDVAISLGKSQRYEQVLIDAINMGSANLRIVADIRNLTVVEQDIEFYESSVKDYQKEIDKKQLILDKLEKHQQLLDDIGRLLDSNLNLLNLQKLRYLISKLPDNQKKVYRTKLKSLLRNPRKKSRFRMKRTQDALVIKKKNPDFKKLRLELPPRTFTSWNPLVKLDKLSRDIGIKSQIVNDVRTRYKRERSLMLTGLIASHEHQPSIVEKKPNVFVFKEGDFVYKIYQTSIIADETPEIIEDTVINEILAQTLAHNLVKPFENIKVPKILEWGTTPPLRIPERGKGKAWDIPLPTMFIKMEYAPGLPLTKVDCISQKVTEEFKTFENVLQTNFLQHDDLQARNLIYDEKSQILYVIDWGQANFTKSSSWARHSISSWPKICD